MDEMLGRLETQMVILARRIENTARRSTLHKRMDRAAYLLARTLDDAPAAVNDLARTLQLDGSTVTRQVAVMESRGFVRRDADPDDRRAWILTLTDDGRAEMEAIRAARKQRFADRLGGWTPADVDTFSRLLERFNHDLTSAASTAAQHADELPHKARHRSDHARSVVRAAKRAR